MAPRIFHPLNQWLKSYGIAMPPADMRLLMRYTELIQLPKGSILMAQNKKVQDLYFINSGIARLHSKVAGEDTTIDFVPEQEFASTIIYILNQQPSVYALDAVTDITALHWTREAVLHLRAHITCAPLIEATLQMRLLTWIQDRELDILNLSPEERYHKLFDTYPRVAQEAPLKYIASYLGIQQESLSRIRRKWTRGT